MNTNNLTYTCIRLYWYLFIQFIVFNFFILTCFLITIIRMTIFEGQMTKNVWQVGPISGKVHLRPGIFCYVYFNQMHSNSKVVYQSLNWIRAQNNSTNNFLAYIHTETWTAKTLSSLYRTEDLICFKFLEKYNSSKN